MGDIPDISSFFHSPSTPSSGSSKKAALTPASIQFQATLKSQRRENDELNYMIDNAVANLTHKLHNQMGKMSTMASKLRACQDELHTFRQRMLMPGSIHQLRLLSVSSELVRVDCGNPKALTNFGRIALPKCFGMPTLKANIVMVERTDDSIEFLKDDAAIRTDGLGSGGLANQLTLKVVEEVVIGKCLVRHVFASNEGPIDCIAVPIFSVLGDVVAVLECLTPTSSANGESDTVMTMEDECTLWNIGCLLSLGIGSSSKVVLNAKLAVDDTVRRLYAETTRATKVSSSWKAVAEAACFLSGVGGEDDVIQCGAIISHACRANFCRVYVVDEAAEELWTGGDKIPGGEEEVDKELVSDLLVKCMEASETQTASTQKYTVVASPCKEAAGRVVGVVVLGKWAAVNVETGKVENEFGREEVMVCAFLSGLVGGAIERSRAITRERKELQSLAKESLEQVERMKGGLAKKKVKLETRTVGILAEGKMNKVELAKARERIKVLVKMVEGEGKKRKKAEHLLQRVKDEAKDLVGGLKKATVKKNGAIKVEIEGLCKERGGLIKDLNEMSIERDKWQREAEKQRRRVEGLEKERAGLWQAAKASELLKKNHAELSSKLGMLLRESAAGSSGSPVKGRRRVGTPKLTSKGPACSS